MLRFTTRRLLFDKLGRTKLGAEVLAQTRGDMKQLEKKDNWFVRFFTRRRPIDYLAIEVDGPLTKELHPSFQYAKTAFTLLLMIPMFGLLVTGKMQPTYYLIVPTGVLSKEKYNKMWELSDWYVVLGGQLLLFVLLYDLSVYIRYPCFAYILAPAYRKMGLVRAAPVGTMTMKELKSHAGRVARARPLGQPLHTVRKTAGKEHQNPFGKSQKK